MDAAGGASKVLKMLAEKVRSPRQLCSGDADRQTRAEQALTAPVEDKEEKKEAVVAKRKVERQACELIWRSLRLRSQLMCRQCHESHDGTGRGGFDEYDVGASGDERACTARRGGV